MTFWEDSDGAKLGHEAEHQLVGWIRSRGVYVLPATDFSLDATKPPKISCQDRDLVMPDFLCAKEGRCWWIEAKAKSGPLRWRNHNGREYHGFTYRHFVDYQEIAKQFGMRIDLIILESSTGTWLYGKDMLSMDQYDLGTGSIEAGASAGTRMVNFLRSDFVDINVT